MRSVRFVAAGIALLVASAAPAIAGDQPGFLVASDFLPDVVNVGDESTLEEVYEFVLDAEACSNTLEPDEKAAGAVAVQYFEQSSQATVLQEVIVTYPDARTARAAFKHHKSTAAGSVKCGTVTNQVEGANSIAYEPLRVPKIGKGSYGVSRGAEGSGTEPAHAIEFVADRYTVILTTFGNEFSVTVKDLKQLARKAAQQLDAGV